MSQALKLDGPAVLEGRPVEILAQPRDARGVVRALWELSKPGVTRLVLVTSALGVIAAPGALNLRDLLLTVLGTALVVAGANALNMFIERESDCFMTRTRTRPLPTGRLAPDESLAFGVAVSIAGLAILALSVSRLSVALAAGALLSYVLVYTPLKRVGPVSLYVGAVPGALPPAIGYTALTGSFDRVAMSLFLILCVWQLPHFLAISLFRQEEYARADLRVHSVVHGAAHTRRTALALAVLLCGTTLLPVYWQLTSPAYLWIALVSGLGFLVCAVRGLFAKDANRGARAFFFSTMPYLVIVMGALVSTLR